MATIDGFGVVLPASGAAWAPYVDLCLTSLDKQRGGIQWRAIVVVLSSRESDIQAFSTVCSAHHAVLIPHQVSHDGQGFRTPLARNVGAHFSPFKWLLFSDSDLIYPPHALERLAELLQKGSCARLEVRDRAEPPEHTVWSHWREAAQTDAAHAFLRLTEGTTPRNGAAGSLAVPKAAWQAVRGYDEIYRGWGADDEDFADRLNRAGYPVVIPEHLRAVHVFHYRAATNTAHTEANRQHYFAGRDARRIIVNQGALVGGLVMP